MDRLMDAFERDVRTIPSDKFAVYQKGWQGHLGMALVDAVYSKQMRYNTTRGKGLLPRLLAFQQQHRLAGTDLRKLVKLSETNLQDTLGKGVTNGRSKASAVLEAAARLVQLGVYTHDQYDHTNQKQRNAYLHVHGLGSVTHNYFGMLLGYADTKPDTWIIHAVQRVANVENLGVTINSAIARKVVLEAHRRTKLGKTVTHMDHAIWLTERERSQHSKKP